MTARQCPECGENYYGRSDKKFCGDACRNFHNNKQHSDVTNHIRNLNNILRKNRRILAHLFSQHQTKVTVQKLMYEGFNFNYFTHISVKQNRKPVYYCYNYGYSQVKNKYILIKIEQNPICSPLLRNHSLMQTHGSLITPQILPNPSAISP